jgi:Na+/alanine symporter
MLETLTSITGDISGALWNSPITLLTLLGTGIYLTVRLRFVQISGFKHSFQLIQGKFKNQRTRKRQHIFKNCRIYLVPSCLQVWLEDDRNLISPLTNLVID